MSNVEFWKILITVSIAVFGWIIGDYFNSKRDRAIKRRELITNHLINAYKILAIDITHKQLSLERKQKLESVIAELQLFGSEKQIELAKKLAIDIKNGGDFLMDDLINNLRSSLRKELGLSMVNGNVTWLRFDSNKSIKS